MEEFSRLRRLFLASLSGTPLLGLAQAAPAGAITSSQSAGGAVGRPASEKLSDILHAKDFGALGDGVADDTAALAALLSAMQEQGKPGVLGGVGRITRYLVRAGELGWRGSSSSEQSAGPTLFTAGRVIISVKPGSANAPILYVHNDRLRGGRFVHGGYIGALEFEDRTGDVAPARHGIQLSGVEFMRFGPLFSEQLQGDLVHIEAKGTLLSGDQWHVAGCIFESLTTWNTAGWTLNNNSPSHFFNGNELGMLWNINGAKGLWRGPGSANELRFGSAQGSNGWAIDWTPADASSSVQANKIVFLELDGPEFGVRINGVQAFAIEQARIVHRHRELPRQAGTGAAWPIVSLRIGGREGLATSSGQIATFHYLRSSITDATKAALGTLVDLQSDPTTHDIEIRNRIAWTQPLRDHVPGHKIDIAKYIVGHDRRARDLRVEFNGQSFLRNSNSNALIARIAGGALPSDYGTRSRLDFSSVLLDEGNNYNVQGKEYSVPADGKYAISARIMVDAASGELVRLAVLVNGAMESENWSYAAGGQQSFGIDLLSLPLSRGDRIAIAGASSAGSAFAAGSAGILANNRIEVVQLS
jgi:hypothetical protein